jgi:hypothetical protein
MLGDDHAMDSENIRGSEKRPEIPWVLDLIERQKKGRFTAFPRDLLKGGQVQILGGGNASNYALMVG